MLIRFIVNNIASFGEQKEFNMLPMPRLRTFNTHKYTIGNFNILKMASIYGANASGKSNLIQSLNILKILIVEQEITNKFSQIEFKFKKEKKPQVLVIEFFHDNKPFIYGIEIFNNIVITEELYISGLGKSEDELVFERKTEFETKITTIKSPLFEKDEESRVLKKVIEKNLSKPNKLIFKLLTTLDNDNLKIVRSALDWFEYNLEIITPQSKPDALVYRMDIDTNLKNYTESMMQSLFIGIDNIFSEKKTLESYFGEDDIDAINGLKEKLDLSEHKVLLFNKNKEEMVIAKEDNEYFVKKLKLEHKGKDDIKASFHLEEESDGTVRLLELAPAFKDMISSEKVYIVDEIERSIHPLLIKELVRKFSCDDKSKGQLIFTTHESNLLDQDIFRQDEIWFAEKDKNGSTDLYSLSDFKEHNTIDIRKGYLNGRYGSIPFLANLKDLNWHKYDTVEK